MFTRAIAVLATLATLLVSSTASAWAVPVHLCTVPDEPTPVGDPIPCSYTNEDGQTFNGIVTRSGNGEVLCTGLVAPNPKDPTHAADIAKLYESLGEDRDAAPVCAIAGTKKGAVLECSLDDGEDKDPWAAVKVCGGDWCHELTSYIDCADYYSTEPVLEGVTCYDVT